MFFLGWRRRALVQGLPLAEIEALAARGGWREAWGDTSWGVGSGKTISVRQYRRGRVTVKVSHEDGAVLAVYRRADDQGPWRSLAYMSGLRAFMETGK